MTNRYVTPLRYPGGKLKIAPFIKSLISSNNLFDGHYFEPYAGGAGVAFSVLFDEFMSSIHINDINRSIYAFWHSVLHATDELCALIKKTKVDMETWHYQKQIQRESEKHSTISLGFSTFFLNRTNRSGIIMGGVIGGKNQTGKWKIDARFNKPALINRIKKIAEYKPRIQIANMDAIDFLKKELQHLPQKTLIYLDPPYYHKAERLYENHYAHNDHVSICDFLKTIPHPWIVTYDNKPEIQEIYSGFRMRTYNLNYSAQSKCKGSEVMIFSDNIELPQPD